MKSLQMFTLLNEVHFWTQKGNTCIRDSDFGALKYYDKKSTSDSLLAAGKKSYVEKRGVVWSPSNKRPNKLKDSLKELEEQLDHNKVLYLQWRDNCSLQIFLNTGLLINILVNPITGDVQEITFDKYMSGKFLSDYVSDIAITSTHALFTYADNQVTLVYFIKPSPRNGFLKKWASLDAKIQTVELAGPTGRRLGRKVSINTNTDMLLVWWKCGRDEVYPWSPVVRDQDRANVHIYNINGTKVELQCYYRTEHDPIMVTFSQYKSNVIHSVQQKISRKGEVKLEWAIFEITRGRLQQTSVVSFQLPTHSTALSLSVKENYILIACIDGSLMLTDSSNSVTNISKAAFIPSLISWHPDGSLIVIANDRGQLQYFDLSLTCVKAQLLSEDITPSSILDLGTYFKHQSTLLQICWNKRTDTAPESSTQPDCLLLLLFERGPICMVRLIGGRRGLTGEGMVGELTRCSGVERAVGILLTMDWETEPATSLASLQIIVNHLLRLPLSPHTEELLEKSLGSYLAPKKPISQSTNAELGDSIHDLSRKFFHHLLRYQVFEKAFRLAIDLGDYDLFMDIHNFCKKTGNAEMALAALEKAEQLSDYSSSRSGSTSCDCSESVCSCCSDSTCSSSRESRQGAVPPLPIIPPPPRHKVKFSNTVTRITLPEERLLNLPDEISMNTVGLPNAAEFTRYHHRCLPKPSDLPSTSNNSQPLFPNSVRNNIPVPLPPPEEEDTGKIKVVHFGLV